MRLSTVFELLLIFLFIAFAASRHVDKKHGHKKKDVISREETVTKPTGPNRYCQCANLMCNCCRDFSLPVVSLKGPGCANIAYLNGDNMRLTMSFGDRILRNFTMSGKRPRPVCMSLPGGESRFCGRVYGIQRIEDQFKACLALELRSDDDVKAAFRVSCFKFGPNGVKLEPGRPIPVDTDDYDEEDDDYDIDDDDDDDDDDFALADSDDDDAENDVESDDYTGFSALSDEFLDGFFGSSETKKKKKKQNVLKTTTVKPTAPSKKPLTTSAPVLPSTTEKTVSIAIPTAVPTTEKDANHKPVTSSSMVIHVLQDGKPIEPMSVTNVPQITTTEVVTDEPVTDRVEDVTSLLTSVNEMKTTTQEPVPTESSDKTEDDAQTEHKLNEEEENLDEEEEEEEDEEEGDEEDKEHQDKVESTTTAEPREDDDDDGNILDGLLDDEDSEEDEKTNDDEDEEDDEDDDDESFRMLVPKEPQKRYKAITLEEQEQMFPGLSALIRPSPYVISSGSQERYFPGLVALLRPPPPSLAPQTGQEPEFAFPAVRSARTHRRMRLPPLP